MGVWSAEVSGNDVFTDAKLRFFDYFYYETASIEEIENRLIAESIESGLSGGELHDIYFATAYCEWKCGCLSEKIFSTVENIISSGENLEYWKQSAASPQILKQREKSLNKFLVKLKSKNFNPVKRRKKIRFTFNLKAGDVFVYYSKRYGVFGGGLVLDYRESDLQTYEEEYNFRVLIALSNFNSPDRPTTEQILDAEVCDVFWNGGCVFGLPKKGIAVIGNVADKIDKDYSEYFGSFKVGERIFNMGGLRPDFEDLMTGKAKYTDIFSVRGIPMTTLFKKENLRKTNDILKS